MRASRKICWPFSGADVTTAGLTISILVFLALGAGALARQPQAVDPFYLKMLDKAEKDFSRRDYEEAAKNFEIAAFGLAQEKNLLARAYVYLGICHYHLKNIAKSEEYLRQASEVIGEAGIAAPGILESARPDLDKLLTFFNIRLDQDTTPPQESGVRAKSPPGSSPPVSEKEAKDEGQKMARHGAKEPPKQDAHSGSLPGIKQIDEIKEGDLLPLELVEKQPVAVRRIQPLYPPEALRAGIEGTVMVNALISETGAVIKTKVIRGIKGALELDAAAQRAVTQWRFEPATIKGIRVRVWMPVAIEFKKPE